MSYLALSWKQINRIEPKMCVAAEGKFGGGNTYEGTSLARRPFYDLIYPLYSFLTTSSNICGTVSQHAAHLLDQLLCFFGGMFGRSGHWDRASTTAAIPRLLNPKLRVTLVEFAGG